MKYAVCLTLLCTLSLPILAQERGPFLVTEYRTISGEHEYELFTMAEFQERHKIVRQEQHVFAPAMRAAQVAWLEQGNSISFPRHFSRPQLIRKGHYPTRAAALKKLSQLELAEQKRHDIRQQNDANTERWKRQRDPKGQRHTTKAEKEKLFKKQREARGSAKSIMQDKMEELMAEKNAHNLRGEEVFKGVRSR